MVSVAFCLAPQGIGKPFRRNSHSREHGSEWQARLRRDLCKGQFVINPLSHDVLLLGRQPFDRLPHTSNCFCLPDEVLGSCGRPLVPPSRSQGSPLERLSFRRLSATPVNRFIMGHSEEPRSCVVTARRVPQFHRSQKRRLQHIGRELGISQKCREIRPKLRRVAGVQRLHLSRVQPTRVGTTFLVGHPNPAIERSLGRRTTRGDYFRELERRRKM